MPGGFGRYRFVLSLLLPAMPVLGYLAGSNYYTLVFGFIGIALLDVTFGRDARNPPAQALPALEQSQLYSWIIYVCAAADLALIVWGASVVRDLAPPQALGLMLSIGFVTGAQGITVAHELGHGRSGLDRLLSRVLLTAVCYGHFYVEHNRGHHVRVATPDDPASARAGESFYAFYPRAVAGGWLDAWGLEAKRLRRHGLAFWRNEMLWYTVVPVAVVAVFSLAWGPRAGVFFLVQSWMAFTLLEAVNYIQHYGLSRARVDGGGYERIGRLHSWNASETLSNCFLIHLPRHSDHHEHPSRPYQALAHHDDSPQMPTGYSGMLLLALVPPLWFAVMNARLRAIPG